MNLGLTIPLNLSALRIKLNELSALHIKQKIA